MFYVLDTTIETKQNEDSTNNSLSDVCGLIFFWKAEHLYSALHGRPIQTTLKHWGIDHTVLPAINTMPAFTS